MAVDLGTANTLVYVRGRGIVLSEPSASSRSTRARARSTRSASRPSACSAARPGTISAIRPLKDGVIADFDVTEEMLRHFIQKVHQNRWAHPRVVVCVPSGVTGVEKRAVEEACLSAGARQAYLIEEPMAAAIGAGLPVGEPTGSMVVDIGGGTSEVAVISLGGIVVSQSIRVGGDELDEAIINYAKREYKLLIGQQTAEEVKLEIGSAYPMDEEVQAEIRGRDMVSGPAEDRRAHQRGDPRRRSRSRSSQIIDAVKETLDRTPPELASDIMDRGIMLAGGGSLLQGLDERLREETQMPAHLAESPLTCVAVGSGRSLEEFEVIHRTNKNSTEPPAAATSRRGRRRRTPSSTHDRRVRQDGPPPARSARAARRLLPDPPHRLLRRVGRRRLRRASSAASLRSSRPIQEGASRALKPVRDLVRLGRRHVRRQGRARRPAHASATSCAGRSSPAPAPCARTRSCAASCDLDQTLRARPARPGDGARHRAGPDALVPDDQHRQGLRATACARPAGRSPARASSASVTSSTGSTRGRHADHRPLDLGVSARDHRERA